MAIERYRKLVAHIRNAHGAMDADRCGALIDQWYGVEQTTGFAPDAHLAAEIAPVEEWLEELSQAQAEENAYDTACLTLEQAIDDNRPRDTLEKLAADVLRCDRGMPDLLAARFNSKMEDLARGAKRKFTLRLTGVIAALIMLGIGITLGILRYNQAKDLDRWRNQIAAAIDKDDMNAATKLLDSLASDAPDFMHDPEIESLRAKRDKIVTGKKDRKDEFEQCIARVIQAGEKTPDEESLERAETLAADFREKNLVQDWREKIQAYRDATNADMRKTVKTQMDRLEVIYAAVVDSEDLDAAAVEAKAKECVDLADEIGKLPGVDLATKSRLASIRTQSNKHATAIRDKAARATAIEQRLTAIQRTYATPATLASALEKFASDYPDHYWSADFTKAAAMSPQWTAVQQWRAGVSKWNGNIRITTPKQAADRKAEVDKYLKNYANGPYADIAGQCDEYFKTAIAALGEDGPKNLSGISRVFAGTVLSNIGMIKMKDGSRYYYRKQPTKASFNGTVTAYRVDYIYDLDLSTKNKTLAAGNIETHPGPAPQVSLSAKVQKQITGFKGSGWETFYVELAGNILADKNTDSILKAQLLGMLLTQAKQCDPCDSAGITKMQTIINGLYIDELGWINPVDSEANQKRSIVRSFINRMNPKTLTDIVSSIDGKLKALISGSAMCEPAGVIMGSAREIRLGSSAENGVLYVIRTDTQNKSSFHRIGEVIKGKAKMDSTVITPDPRGTLVFIKKNK
ncbi:MAG: hypothetical protein HN350_18765 [Phycisphaerales bacterium]|nr:hypothetical protein [Phycisphaerales bacterium]